MASSDKRGFVMFLLACCALRWGTASAVAADLLPVGMHEGWHFFYGKDYLEYFGMARAFVDGRLGSGWYPVGYPLFLANFVLLTGAAHWREAATAVAVFQSFFLAGLAIFLLGFLGERITGRRLAGALAAFLWAVLPLAAWLFFGLFGGSAGNLRAINVPSLIWARMYSEPLCSSLILLSMFFAVTGGRSFRRLCAAAFFAGLAFLVREDAVVLILLAIAYLLLFRLVGVKGLAALGGIVLLVIGVQLAYNYLQMGNPFISNHFTNTAQFAARNNIKEWSFQNVLFLVKYVSAHRLFLVLFLVFALLPLAVFLPRFPGGARAWFLPVGFLYAFGAFYGFYGATRTDFVRFLMPVYFSAALVGGAFLAVLYERLGPARKAGVRR